MEYIIQNKAWEINKDYNKEKLLFALVDRPDYINSFGNFIWKNNKGQFHRNYDLPAIIYNNGSIFWYKNNQLHREDDKPAIIFVNSVKEYWLNGKHVP